MMKKDSTIQARKINCYGALAAFFLAAAFGAAFGGDEMEKGGREEKEGRLRNIRQITFAGAKNGEAYFSPDGESIVFQGVREAGNPFYQIYRMDLRAGGVQRVSPGIGKTTCAFFHPNKPRLLFSSTHLDVASEAKQKEEIERLKAGPPKRYSWDFDPAFDIFESGLDGGNLIRLTDAQGYDAEASYSPDGKSIVFCSYRDGDGEIYVMDSDGKNPRRLTAEKGYDGGPFFSPDGKQIVWRHFEDESQKTAEIWLMDADGSNKRQITRLKSISWAPNWHPSMKWIVFASNVDDPAFELYAIHPDGSELTRLTNSQGFDGLPAISPDGRTLMWTSNRSENRSQLFSAELALPSENSRAKQQDPEFEKLQLEVEEVREKVRDEAASALSARIRRIREAGEAFNLEHEVATQFFEAGLRPFGSDENVDPTFFIQGPSVSGWLPPHPPQGPDLKGWLPPLAETVMVAAYLKADDESAAALAVVSEAIRRLTSKPGFPREAMDKEPVTHPEAVLVKARRELYRGLKSGICVTAANTDAMDSILDSAHAMLKKTTVAQSHKIISFVSLSGLGGVKNKKVRLLGTGTGFGWREMAEHLSALYPRLTLIPEDDPAGAPELEQFIKAEIPCIAIGGFPEQRESEAGFETASAVDPEIIGLAADCVRLLTFEGMHITFTPYDAAAAKAAATAALRPYLGTVPEYGAEGVVGVKLSGVRDASPAQAAGIKAGDVILELNGKSIKDVNEYLQVLESLKPGVETTIKVLRAGKVETLSIRPASR